MSNVTAVNDADFETAVLRSEQPVLVDFWAAWCGPCRMIAPIVEDLASEFGEKAKILKMDVDCRTIAVALDHLGRPTTCAPSAK